MADQQFDAASSKRRGRPQLGVKPTLVRLPEGVPERIDALEGKNRRAEFIRDAVVSELERREAQTATTPSEKPPAGVKPTEGE